MDKIQKIREEVEMLQDACMDEDGNIMTAQKQGAYDVLCKLDTFIDSLQEEPKFKVGDRIKFKGIHNEDVTRAITNIQKGEGGGFRYFFADGSIHSIGGDEIELVEEPVSEDLEKEMDNYLPTVFSKDMDNGEPRFTTWFKALRKTAIYFAKWQKRQLMKDAIEYTILDQNELSTEVATFPPNQGLGKIREGDSVKIIIVKEN